MVDRAMNAREDSSIYLEGRCRIVFPSKFGIGDMGIDVSSTVERLYWHVEWRRRIGAFMVLMDSKKVTRQNSKNKRR